MMKTPTSLHGAADQQTSAEILSDEEVVRRVLDGDTASFELIMRRYNQRLFRIVRSIVGSEAETEDVMQEAYLRAFEHLCQFEGRSKFSTWLTKIAVHEATARRRQQRRLHLVSPEDPPLTASTLTPPARDVADDASAKELGAVLTDALEALPMELRVVFTLRVVEQLSTEQTAECLELSPANVKVRLHRARKSLQHWIDRKIGSEARRLYVFAGEDCDRVVRKVMERIAGAKR